MSTTDTDPAIEYINQICALGADHTEQLLGSNYRLTLEPDKHFKPETQGYKRKNNNHHINYKDLGII